MEARKSVNEVSPVKVSFNDFVIKAVAHSLKQHPKINSSWLGDKIRYNQHVHIGVAVAVEEGLLVPVVRFADQKGLAQISGEVKEYGQKAKDKKLQPSDWEGNTFTISNLGMFGIEEFTAIINPPERNPCNKERTSCSGAHDESNVELRSSRCRRSNRSGLSSDLERDVGRTC
jgi:pyruvate dehydrogenase E2 component (dihydrolipoamide acetyltransferase)